MTPESLAETPRQSPNLPFPTGAVRLHDWGVIRASGADARSFLHGQLTQDVEHLTTTTDGDARLAGYCTAKGRLLASFVLWAHAADDVLLACSADVLPAALKRLSMFVLRAKCKLSDASGEVPLWGLVGAETGARPRAVLGAVPGAVPGAEPAGATNGATSDAIAGAPWSRRSSTSFGDRSAAALASTLIRLPDSVVDGAVVPRFLQAGGAEPALPLLDIDSWRWLEVLSGVPRIVAATVEQFVPQMVNLELVGGVNFQKGCYPGQEIVARSQYRGTLKRRAQVLDADAPLSPGDEIFHSADPTQPAGMVVLAGSHGARHAALVELKLSATRDGSLHAGAADGPALRLAALPYAIPTEAA